MSDRHQSLLSKRRQKLINDYLTLHHTSGDFITTPEDLEKKILRTFTSSFNSEHPYQPQSYGSMLQDMESGTSLTSSYIYQMRREKEQEIMNAVMGTVGDGKPGYEEVMREIQESFSNEDTAQADEEVDQAISEVEPTDVESTSVTGLESEIPIEEADSTTDQTENTGYLTAEQRLYLYPEQVAAKQARKAAREAEELRQRYLISYY